MQKFYPLIAALLANVTAQILKPLFFYIQNKKWNFLIMLESGGFPSSHTSMVVALTLALGLESNFESHTFFVSLIFSSIIIYDSANVRYYAGQNIKVTRELIQDIETLLKTNLNKPVYQEKIKLVLGHKWIEVIGGILLGVLVSLLLYSSILI